ncbi:MAG TPA: GTPase HflX [Rubrobacteraceae bacterium]|nr:GTPase HflX [Rubrobacteraceae bacterium]
MSDTENTGIDRAVLVGAGEGRYLDELGRLAGTLGVKVVAEVEQNRRDGSGYLGKGKREELRDVVAEAGAAMVIADDELTASQARVLERSSGASVVDRTELIIRIFEAHARDSASRLEVELADLQYRLPRVKGRNEALSRLGGGGVTTRGPGEQQLEYDRRVIRERMSSIERKLEEERSARAVQGSRLRKSGPPTVALVGYTNAGKTTILNRISGAGRSTMDRLFETLETTSRLVEGRADGKVARPDFVLTDTVGFIRKLPKQLVRSFESTMEVARDADVRVLCADASSAELEDEISTVREILDDENAGESGVNNILCLNKWDLISKERGSDLRAEYPDAVTISARNGETHPLLERIYDSIAGGRERMNLLIPHSEYANAARLYGVAEIHSSNDTTTGVCLDVTLPKHVARRYGRYRVA